MIKNNDISAATLSSISRAGLFIGEYDMAGKDTKEILGLLFAKLLPILSPDWRRVVSHKEQLVLSDILQKINPSDEAFLLQWLEVKEEEVLRAEPTVTNTVTLSGTGKKRGRKKGNKSLSESSNLLYTPMIQQVVERRKLCGSPSGSGNNSWYTAALEAAKAGAAVAIRYDAEEEEPPQINDEDGTGEQQSCVGDHMYELDPSTNMWVAI
jgi:hypothetical protein